MDGQITADMKQLEEYVNSMDGILSALFAQQSEINTSYNKATQCWCDRISQDTGNALAFAGTQTEQFNNYFMDLLGKLNVMYSIMTEGYLEGSWEGSLGKYELESRPNIKEATNTMINGTHVDSIIDFERALASYIEKTRNCIKSTQKALENATSWNDGLRRKNDEQTAEFSQNMNQCMMYLENQLEWVTKRRVKFQEALEAMGM